jgi:UDP-N-acetyl-D-mannosaminuronic acid dehydrogenase
MREACVRFQTLSVMGMGYIGLPTASTFAAHGMRVVGVDINRRILSRLRNGDVHIQEPGLRTLVQAALGSGNLRIKEQPEPSDAFIIAVPTPFLTDKRADMQYVTQAANGIVPHLRAGNLVVLESTSPPRTTIDLVAPLLEQSGLKAGADFHLVYSPERVLPGQILRELSENARVIGGIDEPSAEAGKALYSTFVTGEILTTDATTAEMVKLMENTYRDVNIALANEFCRLADRLGVDVWEAIDLANRHPRVNVLKPGPGVGGHCISVDPWFLVEAAPDLAALIRQARLVNDGQPAYVVDRLRSALGDLKGLAIAALGLTYKPDVDDVRESPALEIARLLKQGGAELRAYDPFLPAESVDGVENEPSLEKALAGADAVVLLVDHKSLCQLKPEAVAKMMPGRLAFDTRGAWAPQAWQLAGFQFLELGGGRPHA